MQSNNWPNKIIKWNIFACEQNKHYNYTDFSQANKYNI